MSRPFSFNIRFKVTIHGRFNYPPHTTLYNQMSLWNDDEFVSDNTLTVNVTRLRGRIKELGIEDIIKTKKGIGYFME